MLRFSNLSHPLPVICPKRLTYCNNYKLVSPTAPTFRHFPQLSHAYLHTHTIRTPTFTLRTPNTMILLPLSSHAATKQHACTRRLCHTLVQGTCVRRLCKHICKPGASRCASCHARRPVYHACASCHARRPMYHACASTRVTRRTTKKRQPVRIIGQVPSYTSYQPGKTIVQRG